MRFLLLSVLLLVPVASAQEELTNHAILAQTVDPEGDQTPASDDFDLRSWLALGNGTHLAFQVEFARLEPDSPRNLLEIHYQAHGNFHSLGCHLGQTALGNGAREFCSASYYQDGESRPYNDGPWVSEVAPNTLQLLFALEANGLGPDVNLIEITGVSTRQAIVVAAPALNYFEYYGQVYDQLDRAPFGFNPRPIPSPLEPEPAPRTADPMEQSVPNLAFGIVVAGLLVAGLSRRR